MSGTRKNVLWVDDEIEFLRSHIMFFRDSWLFGGAGIQR